MKHLIDIINEDKIKYELGKDYEEKSRIILKDLVSQLPAFPIASHKTHSAPGMITHTDGEFYFNEFDVMRSQAESSQYIGNANSIRVDIDTKNNDINVDALKDAFRVIFGIKINEGIFSDNVKKDMPEYQWVSELYQALSKYFNTKKFNIKWEQANLYGWRSSVFKDSLLQAPTIKKDGLIVSLYSIFADVRENWEWNKVSLCVFVYEEKDKEKIAAIKAHNNALKPLDIVGRELMSGDTVAYALMGGYGKYNGMQVGVIDSVSKEMVKVDGKGVRADRCCLISRKDGKRIE